MKTNEILLLAGAGVALWYFGFYKPQSVAPAPASVPGSLDYGNPATAGLLNAPSIPISTNQGAVSIPVPGANQVTQAGSNPLATLAQQQTIFSWATSMNAKDQATFFASWPRMTLSDISGLMDLIVNEWQGGQPVTPARTSFWNNWRKTYGIDIG